VALFRPTSEAAVAGGPAAAGRPEAIKAIPVRHWGRWLSAAIVIYLVAALLYSLIRQPNVQFDVIWHWLFKPTVMHGIVNTIELTIIAMVIGGVGGTILAVMRLSDNPVLTTISWVYIWFFRGTPVLVQILIWGNLGVLYPRIFLGLPFTGIVFGSSASSTVVSTTVAAILALGLNEAAYAAEIVRAGIISVEPGQAEAALSLGMPSGLTMRRVVLPQAMRVIIPPMGNETISMLKTTSLVVVISGTELLSNLQIAYSQNFLIMPLLLVACFWYIVMTTILTVGQHYLEAYFGRGFGQRETEAAEKRAAKRAGKADNELIAPDTKAGGEDHE
jgi:polar amino acid transport system permease protein